MFNWIQFWGWFYLAFILSAIPVAFMIILEKRSPFKTAAWILILVLVPIAGVFFYLIFGQEYRKRKMFSTRGLKGLKNVRRLRSEQLQEVNNSTIVSQELKENSHIIRLLLNNSSGLLTTGNKLKLLKNGEQTYEAIFNAIEKARHHIHLEFYIVEDDNIGKKLIALLKEKAAHGVEVRIIVDDVGSWDLSSKFFDQLRKAGIEIYSFMEVRFPRLTSKVNYRNHRKIVVVDGKTGFIGGLNIADKYLEGLPKIGPWHDTHLQIKGDAATSLQIIFSVDWYFITHQNLYGLRYFPPFSNADGIPVQISASGPDYDWATIFQAYFAAITSARKKVYLTTPYLMPPSSMLTALKTAALSQVDVRIIIPEKSDSSFSTWCSFSFVEELLEAGVKIYLFENGFIHSKYMLVDDNFATIGTSNFDYRSFETNFEANAFIYQKEFSVELEEHFNNDLIHCREINLKEWQKRSFFNKVREALAHIISPMF